MAPDETVPEVDSEEITRLESECTIWWQPPLWWDQTPMWMSRAPRWLNDVAVRDDSALLQVGEDRGAEEAQAVIRAASDAEAAAEHAASEAAWSKKLDEVQKQEAEALEASSIPLRNFASLSAIQIHKKHCFF